MKASANAKDKIRKVKGETDEKLRALTNDPTLEGRDENSVGRVERKLAVLGKRSISDTTSTEVRFQNAVASVAGVN
jgi:hypothetical protein